MKLVKEGVYVLHTTIESYAATCLFVCCFVLTGAGNLCF